MKEPGYQTIALSKKKKMMHYVPMPGIVRFIISITIRELFEHS